MNDYTGQKFNYLTVLSQFIKEKKLFFHCRCDCGREKNISSANVLYSNTKTCGRHECKRQIRYGYLKDCIGKKFNSLTVLSVIKKGKRHYFYCRCDCGREKVIEQHDLINGYRKSCGWFDCQKKYVSRPDYTGQKFSLLTVLSEFREGDKYYFTCRCDCGREKKANKHSVLIGRTKTCGSQECKDKIPGYRGIPDYTGKKFNKLTILSQFRKIRYWYCICQCDCGRKKTAKVYSVLIGQTKSCGCETKKRAMELSKKAPINISRVENSSVFGVLRNMGYKKYGRKIGVNFIKFGAKYKWIAISRFKGVDTCYRFDTYYEALKKRLQIQDKILMPFIRRNKKLLPKYIDIDYWLNLNSHITFNIEKYEKERIAGKIFN